MRTLIFFTVFTVITSVGFAQSMSKSDIGKVKLRNSGAIIQQDVVKGYYYFYKLEKKDKNNNNYQMSITDENLREINSVIITRPKYYLLVDAVFNEEAFGFLFYDMKEEQIEIISYDQKLKEGGTVVKELKNKYSAMTYKYLAQADVEPMQAFLLAVPKKGFLLYGLNEGSKSDYEIEFYDNQMKMGWRSVGPDDFYDFENAGEAFQHEEFVGSMIMKRTGLMDLDPEIDLLMQQTSNGKVQFRIPLETQKYKIGLSEVVFMEEKQQFAVFGEYFLKEDNLLKDDSQGFITVILDMYGKIVLEKTNSWEADISACVSEKDKKKFEKTSILFHDYIQTNDGKIFAIGEQYKRGGVPMMAASVNIFNMVVFEFDKDFSIKKLHVFEKEKNSLPLPRGAMVFNSKMMSYYAKSLGGFDYLFTQQTAENETFVVNYLNYNRDKGKKGVNQLGSIVYTPEKTFSLDVMDMKRDSDKYFLYRAKEGYIMLCEYFAKEMRLDSRLEKLNY
jgi:hypothetical protein